MIHVDVYTAAYLLKITPAALYKAIHSRKIPYFHDGRRYWVPLTVVAERLHTTTTELMKKMGPEERLSHIDINVDIDPDKPG